MTSKNGKDYYSLEELEVEFKNQVDPLNDLLKQLYPIEDEEFVIKIFFKGLSERLKRKFESKSLEVASGNYPFLLVIPPQIVSLKDQLKEFSLVVPKINHGGSGALINYPQSIRPAFFYLIFDVNDGGDNRETSPDQHYQKNSKKEPADRRYDFGFFEACSLLRKNGKLLDSHNIILAGAKYFSMYYYGIGKDKNGNKAIFQNIPSNANKFFGIPSFKTYLQ